MQSPARANKAIFFFALYFLVVQFILVLIALVVGLAGIVTTGMLQIIGLFVSFLFYLLVTKQTPKQVLPWKGLSLKNILLVVAISLAILPMVRILFYLLSFVFASIILDFLDEAATAPMWLSIVVIGVLPAFFEEFWFRGALYTEYRARGVSVLKTALITGLFFGLIHMNFQQAIYAGALGVLYTYLVYYTRSILAPILGHFINNSISAILVYIEPYQTWHGNLSQNPVLFLLGMGGLSLAMLPVLILCLKKLKRYHAETEPVLEPIAQEIDAPAVEPAIQPDAGPKVYTWGFWAALAVFGLMTLLTEVTLRSALG
ncbi:MAG: CPBP family intramembrane metalloprotease [Oscillospiraceae bacterium]|nr:CPBP family intramembrane metalloprotease [Oscillospiraceae bacterium]